MKKLKMINDRKNRRRDRKEELGSGNCREKRKRKRKTKVNEFRLDDEEIGSYKWKTAWWNCKRREKMERRVHEYDSSTAFDENEWRMNYTNEGIVQWIEIWIKECLNK